MGQAEWAGPGKHRHAPQLGRESPDWSTPFGIQPIKSAWLCRLAPPCACARVTGECTTPPCAPRTHFRAQARRDVRRRAGKYARAEGRSGPLRARGLVVASLDLAAARWGTSRLGVAGLCGCGPMSGASSGLSRDPRLKSPGLGRDLSPSSRPYYA